MEDDAKVWFPPCGQSFAVSSFIIRSETMTGHCETHGSTYPQKIVSGMAHIGEIACMCAFQQYQKLILSSHTLRGFIFSCCDSAAFSSLKANWTLFHLSHTFHRQSHKRTTAQKAIHSILEENMQLVS